MCVCNINDSYWILILNIDIVDGQWMTHWMDNIGNDDGQCVLLLENDRDIVYY